MVMPNLQSVLPDAGVAINMLITAVETAVGKPPGQVGPFGLC